MKPGGLQYEHIATGVKRVNQVNAHEPFSRNSITEKKSARYNYNNVAISFRDGSENQPAFSSFQKTDFVLSRALYGPVNQIEVASENVSDYPGSSSYFNLTGGL